MKTKLIIPMAGEGSHMGGICQHIPKGLVNYHNHTYLYHIYQYYKNCFDECIVSVQSQFMPMVVQYAKNFDLDLTVVIDDSLDGNIALLNKLDIDWTQDKIILNWCDVIPKEVDVCTDENTVTIYTQDNTGRFILEGSTIVATPVDKGDFVGVYVVNQLKDSLIKVPSGDFVDLLMVNKPLMETRPCQVLDLGSLEKLKNTQDTLPKCRYFNLLDIDEVSGKVTKKAIAHEGIDKIQREIEILKEGREGYVKLLESRTNSYVMEYLEGYIPKCESELHYKPLNVVNGVITSDIVKEVSERILGRLVDVVDYLPGYVPVDFFDSVKTLEAYIISQTTEVADIHGDLICDNIVITKDGPVYIDPRGYFGNSKKGPIEYDISKYLYSIYGYYDFNYDVDYIGNYRDYELDVDMSLINEAWVCAHWLALAGFFKNNPIKAIGAYKIGMVKLDRFLNKIVDCTQ